MNGGCFLLALLLFSLNFASFSTPDCLKRAKLEPSGMQRIFANGHILLYFLIVSMMAGSLNTSHHLHQESKKGFNSNVLKCSVFPDNLLHDCSFPKYENRPAWEMKTKDHYATLYQLRRRGNEIVMVLPLSLERYFADYEKNGNTDDLMKYEWARYRTFSTFPQSSPARPIRLTANGFYYIGNGEDDTVRCFSCMQVYHGFKEGDIASDIHIRISPTCPFITGVDKSNVGIHTDAQLSTASGGVSDPERGSTDSMKGRADSKEDHRNGPSSQKHSEGSRDKSASHFSRRQYRYPQFETYQYRLDTFSNWPCPERLEPSVLADAGYFYAGFGDCVRCFSCGGGLRNWEYGDGPLEEHERWFPHCQYLNKRLKERKRVVEEKINSENHHVTSAKSEINIGDKMTSPEEALSPEDIYEENERLKNQLTCKICMDNASDMVFIPCGHMVSCEKCAPHIRKCAICRKLIVGRVKAFMS